MTHSKITLTGSVDILTLLPILTQAANRVRRSRGGLHLELDCLAVDDFTSLSLAQLVTSRRTLREDGAELVLLGCSDRLRSRMVHPLFEALCG